MRYITLAIAFLIGTNAQAQIIRAEPFYVAPEAGVTNLLLDDYPGAAVAYSLRKLDKDYTGSAIRVRRSSDNTEQDIGFLSSGYLDTTAMKTFVGANNGFVVTWYNQADSSGVFGIRDATQTTASNQWRIINSGVIEREGLNPTLNSDLGSTTTHYVIANSLKFFRNVSSVGIFAVVKAANTAATENTIFLSLTPEFPATKSRVFFGKLATLSGFAIGGRRLDADAFATSGASTNTSDFSLYTGISDYINSDAYIYRNGALDSSNSSFFTNGNTSDTDASLLARLGNNYAPNSPWLGRVSEIIVYNTSVVSARFAIETAINSFYSIY